MSFPIPAAAQEAYEKVGPCFAERRFIDGIVHAEAAARLCPDWQDPWWSLTVGYKHARRWQEALDACDRAIALAPDDAEGPRWNAGIAATALGLWDRARAAWKSLGIGLPAGQGPIKMDLGAVPVRVSPRDAPEVVWCKRIDPCRAIIHSVPLPDSGRRYLDLLLHDGEERGKRQFRGVTVPVFDELDLLEPSDFGTWDVAVRCANAEELSELMNELDAADLRVEDWTASSRILCSACSLGEPHEHEGHLSDAHPAWTPERRLGVAARSEDDLRPLRHARHFWRHGVVSVNRVL